MSAIRQPVQCAIVLLPVDCASGCRHEPRTTSARRPGDASLGPTIYEAIEQQLGLKLRPAKRTVETVVIDRVERVPTEN